MTIIRICDFALRDIDQFAGSEMLTVEVVGCQKRIKVPLENVFAERIEVARRACLPDLASMGVLRCREMLNESAGALGPGPSMESVTDVQITTRWGEIAGHLYSPKESPDGLVIYVHGGGWLCGSRIAFEPLCRKLASASSYALLLVDYRLAPEFPFPAGLEDVEDAVVWAAKNMERLIGKKGDLVLAGDSAGANLGVVAAVSLKDALLISRQVYFYPVVDCRFDTPSYVEHAQGLNMTRADMVWFFQNYADSPTWGDPKISPLRSSVAGSPPTWLGLAEYDVLRSEGEAIGQHFAASGVLVRAKTFSGVIHGFARWFNLSVLANLAVEEASEAIRGPSL